MPLAAWRENSSRHVASLRRIRLVFFIAPVSSTITGRDYPQWTDLRKYVAELPVTFELRFPEDTGRVIVDTPAAVEAQAMPELTRTADKILVPVLPSDFDIYACSRCVQNLLLVAKVKRRDNRLGIIANRVRRNTLSYQSLLRFLETLGIPIVATLRDSQYYVRAAELGSGTSSLAPMRSAWNWSAAFHRVSAWARSWDFSTSAA